MEDIRDRLDQTVIDIFQVLADLYDAKTNLEEAMKEGYFQMSRCRYNIGVKRVSADQIIDADISCTRCVSLLENAEDILEKQTKDSDHLDSKLSVFKLECKQTVARKPKKDTDASDKDQSTELRKRGKQSGDSTAETSSGSSTATSTADASKEDENQENKFVLTNPINLFGVLVPQSLRSSQQSFERAVSLSVDVANLQFQLSLLQQKYSRLQERKKEAVEEKGAQ